MQGRENELRDNVAFVLQYDFQIYHAHILGYCQEENMCVGYPYFVP